MAGYSLDSDKIHQEISSVKSAVNGLEKKNSALYNEREIGSGEAGASKQKRNPSCEAFFVIEYGTDRITDLFER